MKEMNLFEIATKNKFRYPYKGMVSTEDLWDLRLEQLDSVFKTLNTQLKDSAEESLLHVESKESKTLTMQIDIVKHIVEVKLAEKQARLDAAEKKQQKQRIMEIMADKKDAALKDMSIEELQKALDSLE